MYIKTSEIKITDTTYDTILKNWQSREFKTTNLEVLDEVNRLELTLRVPYKLKGETSHMRIPSLLKVRSNKHGLSLEMHCSVVKPIIVSVVLGISSSILFFALSSSLMFFLVMNLVISSVIFGIFYFNIAKTGAAYLSKLKNDY